jgi:polyisoprenyl-teichoic acid--peptidoglycan teichoic acid transferase
LSLIPRFRRGALLRFGLGAVIVILFAATTTAVGGLLQFKQLASDLSGTPALKQARVTIADAGSPQTILAVGSDHRFGEPFNAAHTDTMMLVRMDPSSSTINVLSIPRDLRVQIPEHGVPVDDKLNAAYSFGGPNLLVKVIQQNVFPELQVNHIIDINFGGFEQLVNAIGCVYTDVDHRYYNNTAVTDYSSINLQPGYQKLCGSGALSFVRFRHSDSDIVRNARQQDFVRWAKDGYSQDQLISNRDKLVKIFGQHTQTDPDLHTTDGLINLFNLVAFMDGHAIKQIPFPAQLLPCNSGPVTATGAAGATATQSPCYVGADPTAEQRAFTALMTPTVSTPPAAATPTPSTPAARGNAGRAQPPPSDVTVDVADGKAQAADLRSAGMPIYYPRVITPAGQYCTDGSNACPVETASPGSYPRAYTIRDQQGNSYPAYRMTLVINPDLGEYYGIQGTTWQHPPLLRSPTSTETVNGKQLLLFSNGGKLSVVAWRTAWGVYWVSNTLTNTISNRQMVEIAASLTQG